MNKTKHKNILSSPILVQHGSWKAHGEPLLSGSESPSTVNHLDYEMIGLLDSFRFLRLLKGHVMVSTLYRKRYRFPCSG